MDKITVAFMRTGQVLRLGASAAGASSVGDQRDSAGMLEYLCSRPEYCVVVFGQTRDIDEFKASHPDADVHFVTPDVSNLTELSSESEVNDRYAAAAKSLSEYKPDVALNVCGPAPTATWTGNPRGVTTQAWIVKYAGPSLYAMQKCMLPRVCVTNDPRNYPKEAELTYWPWTVPVAMLSQERRSFRKTVWEQRFVIHAAYARAENWWSYKLPYAELYNARPLKCAMIAHSHIDDARLVRGRDPVWSALLCGMDDFVVYGKGWDAFSNYDPVRMPGALKPGDVDSVLQTAKCGVIVPCADGFLTGKLRLYALNGAAPLLYGRGEYLTYDRDERYVPLESPYRVRHAADLRHAVDFLNDDESTRREYVQYLRAATQPDFSALDDCLRAVVEWCKTWDPLELPQRPDWRDHYGGYEKLRV